MSSLYHDPVFYPNSINDPIMRVVMMIFLMTASIFAAAQGWDIDQNNDYSRVIQTTASYLQFAPDGRSIGMGQTGVASTPDVYSMHWNPAKYAFVDNKFGIAASYSNVLWMNWAWNNSWWGGDFDLNTGFINLHSYFRFLEIHALAFSFKSFSWGETTLTDEFGNAMGTIIPYEMSIDMAYSYRISPSFSVAVAAR